MDISVVEEGKLVIRAARISVMFPNNTGILGHHDLTIFPIYMFCLALSVPY